jgi:hypothetical protein
LDPTELLSLLARSLAKIDHDRPWAMRLCQACVDLLRAEGGSLTVSAGPGERAAVSTPGVFEQLEPLQEVLGEGPVHQAMAEDRLVVQRIDRMVEGFPIFSQLAGPVSSDVMLYAVPMRVGGSVVGVFSLYATADPLVRSEEDLQFIADAVGAALLNDLESLDWSEQAQFHQATGMVVAQLGVPPDDALAMIRARAFSQSRSLQAVAVDVIERRLTFSFDEDGDNTERTEEP